MIRSTLVTLAWNLAAAFAALALLCALGRWLGWQWVGAVIISGIGGAVWDAWRCPWRWW